MAATLFPVPSMLTSAPLIVTALVLEKHIRGNLASRAAAFSSALRPDPSDRVPYFRVPSAPREGRVRGP